MPRAANISLNAAYATVHADEVTLAALGDRFSLRQLIPYYEGGHLVRRELLHQEYWQADGGLRFWSGSLPHIARILTECGIPYTLRYSRQGWSPIPGSELPADAASLASWLKLSRMG